MRNPRAFLFTILLTSATILLTSALFGGCATMFHGRQDLEIIGSPDITVENVHGDRLPGFSTGDGVIVHPDPSRTDSVRIVYGTVSTIVALAKNPSGLELLNLASYGVGFPVDDLNHSWFNYAPVYVTIDSSSGSIKSISATSTDWLGETPGERKLHALALFGAGIAFQINENGGLPLPIGSEQIGSPLVTLQMGLGIDYNKQFELFYLFRSDPTYGLSNNNNESAEIDAGDLCLRYFFQKNLFFQGSYGKAYASGFQGSLPANPTFPEVGAAIGWAGDISYISLQYFDGLSAFNVPDYSNVRYHSVYLNFGLNFKI